MSFNGSFGDGEFVDEEVNSNILSLGQEEFKINFEEGGIDQKYSKTKNINNNNINSNNNNNEFTINSNTNNNIFSSVPMEMEIDTEFQNYNNFYDSLLSKELLRYHISNLFNILGTKISIINSQTFYFLKKLSDAKIQNLIKAEILCLKISSNLANFSNIFKKKRKNVLYQVFYILKARANIANKFINSNGSDTFRKKYETKYKKEKDNAINKNNNNIKKLEKDIKDIEKNIKMLTIKETELKAEINNYFKKEKQLNDKIKTIENSNNTMKKSMQSSNISSLGTSSKYETEINSLENTLEANRQLKEGKEEIIKIFMNQVNDLLNEYQVYIDNMNNIDKSKNSNTNDNNTMNIELNDYTNKQNSNLKERMEKS